mmetsp:Transcript_75180/g.213817  ORF Transcript_75180/g.213817 Transcript_75180/m.213817 type:complete len:336 (-) Transcript_75180:290-1297(-)|eukprot:CAMPEP_0119521994 /NCGR_PEP_ID=MMETSP1344-20130328/37510_1 /TAXON_ID=236787 /ORGANISM="Florenciella parvula, Strain CCMP2471" /LENGTH=335 /DNA_ID=CAMNT_0007560009 /DNA_START=268 /DNA_END=1275 /DNA_ORIENTATION=-
MSSGYSFSGVTEESLDELEKQMRDKIGIQTGYGDTEVQARQLEKLFRYFDVDSSGEIDYDEFFAAMVRLNFVGVQREIEALFDRYDEDCSGTIDYKEFSYHVFGIGKSVYITGKARSAVDQVRDAIKLQGGMSGIHGLMRILRNFDTDGSKSLDAEELDIGLRDFGVRLTANELEFVMRYFDSDKSGKVSLEEFYKGMHGKMSRQRMEFVRDIFMSLETIAGRQTSGGGQYGKASREVMLDLEAMMDCYNSVAHPDVVSGAISEPEAQGQVMEAWANGAVEGLVSWVEFLNYYKALSACVADDREFLEGVQSTWSLPSHTETGVFRAGTSRLLDA